MKLLALTFAAAVSAGSANIVQTDELVPAIIPQPHLKLGRCVATTISRFMTVDDGLLTVRAVFYSNGATQFDIDGTEALKTARLGDAVRLCLISTPKGCPKGDPRGRRYRVRNLRTGRSWTMPDHMHYCGGA